MKYKSIIITTNQNDNFDEIIKDIESLKDIINKRESENILVLYTTCIDIISNELFNKGFDITLTDDIYGYFTGNSFNFVRVYHYMGNMAIIKSSYCEFVHNDDFKINMDLKDLMFKLYNNPELTIDELENR